MIITAFIQAEVRYVIHQTMMNELIAEAKKDNKNIVIDFFAEWCGPCKMMSPLFVRVAEDLKATCIFAKVDVDKFKACAALYDVMAMPTVVILKDGKEVGRFVGSKTYTAMKQEIEAFIR